MRAHSEWKEAGKIQKEFRDHPWTWTRTHGFFALMGGFVLQDGVEQTALGHRYYSPDLQLLKTKEIMNPRISEKQISGRSKSDGLGNALLVLQLSWFILQVVARAANKLAITLLEIDTLALATLSLPLFFFWWRKPMAPECHHIFYTSTVSQHAPERNQRISPRNEEPLLNLNMDVDFPITRSGSWLAEIFGKVLDDESIRVLLIVWVVFGGLHLLAWDFQFPTQAEKIIWRVASFTLIATPCCFFLADKMHLISGNTDYALIGEKPLVHQAQRKDRNDVIDTFEQGGMTSPPAPVSSSDRAEVSCDASGSLVRPSSGWVSVWDTVITKI
ncbi:hypothetical protein PAXINDRAFT_102075 [Paxillus involutus ATCC 200175]|uniref:Unplaced genomic scaffold PAXINscaffold_92, whole genome shotgun sequence n=1 Tax=Paxillus involutus ATCC 200175 TaxID=664439 RepID=A0A0C9THG0_PAXIN|nr:hypothetical protein PAXINDRAFT_102075 [Paxillus involutus ATCC 200175]